MKIDKDRASIHVNKARVLLELWRYDDAMRCLDRAIELEPDNGSAYSLKAEIFVKLERHEEADRYYDKAERLEKL